MTIPLVSIIIPVFNTGKEAVKLTEKIIDSGDFDGEILLIDDGSKDNSLDLLKRIQDSKVKVFHKENGGPSQARNFGISKAKGKYLVFIDSDDDIKNDFVSKLVEVIQGDGVALAVTGVHYKKLDKGSNEDVYLEPFPYEKNEKTETFVLRSLLNDGRMYPAFNKIFKSNVVKDNDLKFDETMRFGEDTKFVLDYLKSADGKIQFILEPLYIYSAGTNTSTAKQMEGDWKNWKKCFNNLKKWVGEDAGFNEKKLLVLIYIKWRASWLKIKLKK